MKRFLSELFCSHLLYIHRRHESTVYSDIRDRVLYTDRLNVANFIRCRKCGKIFDTDQYENLYDSKEMI